jgi:hypothetical protein
VGSVVPGTTPYTAVDALSCIRSLNVAAAFWFGRLPSPSRRFISTFIRRMNAKFPEPAATGEYGGRTRGSDPPM